MRILVTGAAGMLGSGLVPEFFRAGHEVIPTDIELSVPRPWGPSGPTLQYLDVRVPRGVDEAVGGLGPDLVCHLAAETSLEYSDDHPDHAFLTNTVATKYVAQACARRDTPIVYISTAGVFDGEKEGAYHEWDDANPINLYGKTKFEGERFVEAWVPNHFIVRAGWMVGGGLGKDHKFVAKIIEQIIAGQEQIFVVNDKFGTPTYVPDFSSCLQGLLASESYGRYHMACEGEGSRADVARVILEVLGVGHRVELVEVGSDHFVDEYYSPRPRSEIMQNLHLELQGLNTMRPWPEALEHYLVRQFGHLIERIDLTNTRPGPIARERSFL